MSITLPGVTDAGGSLGLPPQRTSVLSALHRVLQKQRSGLSQGSCFARISLTVHFCAVTASHHFPGKSANGTELTLPLSLFRGEAAGRPWFGTWVGGYLGAHPALGKMSLQSSSLSSTVTRELKKPGFRALNFSSLMRFAGQKSSIFKNDSTEKKFRAFELLKPQRHHAFLLLLNPLTISTPYHNRNPQTSPILHK